MKPLLILFVVGLLAGCQTGERQNIPAPRPVSGFEPKPLHAQGSPR